MICDNLPSDAWSVYRGQVVSSVSTLPPALLLLSQYPPHTHFSLSLVLQGVLHGLHDVVSPLPEVLAEVERLEGVLVQAVEIGAVPQQLLNNLETELKFTKLKLVEE